MNHLGKEKRQNDKQRSAKHCTAQNTNDWATRTPHPTWGKLGCPERSNCSCSTSGTRHVYIATNSEISSEWGKGGIAITTNISVVIFDTDIS